MSEPRRIAVVAIHGVGNHAQFASAREIGDLLSTQKHAGDGPKYMPFTEVMKRILVRPVRILDKTQPSQEKTWGPLDALARAVFKNELKPCEEDNSVDSLDHQFMKGQLMDYKAERPEDAYQCLRLEGKRVSPPGAPQQEKIVHIYEMYWSDLSRLGTGFAKVFGALYQLLFHLGSVSVNNVLAAAIHFHGKKDDGKDGGKWQIFSRAQWFATAILAWPIPILNLSLAAIVPVILVLSLMRKFLPPSDECIALYVLLGLIGIVGSGYFLSKAKQIPRLLYPAPILIFIALAAACSWFQPLSQNWTEVATGWIVALAALGVVWQIVKVYERQRPGSKLATMWIAGVVALGLVACRIFISSYPLGGAEGYPAIETCLNVMEVIFGFLFLSWVLFYVGQIWAHFAGWRAVTAVKNNPEHLKARRTRWTARLVLALSSLVFLALTISIWAGALRVALAMLPGESQPRKDACGRPCPTADQSPASPPLRYRPVSLILYRRLVGLALENSRYEAIAAVDKTARQGDDRAISKWVHSMLDAGGIWLLPIFLTAFLLALFVLAWALFPSVGAEFFPPGSTPNQEFERKSESMGFWLDDGFWFMRFAGEVLYWTMWLPAVLSVVLNFWLIDWIGKHAEQSELLASLVGGAVAGTAVGILGFSGRLTKLIAGIKPLLGVMLDVDNWLREHPSDSNPTARICGRYVSLLRHICAWRGDNDSQYDAIVIVAHSQGTVITADLLRFLDAEAKLAGSMEKYDPELNIGPKGKKVHFFTMGCPLSQLYGLRFPFLYGWARNDATDPRTQLSDIHPDQIPRPDRLGVEQWINAYRTGDYVGRYLWRGGDGPERWHPVTESFDPNRSRVEFSIGAGAHTHYWDHTGELIGERLDQMIDDA